MFFCELGGDCRDELLWIKKVGGKREIEAVCDFWEDGIVGYLYHKLSQELEVAMDTDEIDFTELQDDIMDEDIGIDLEDTVNDLCMGFTDKGDEYMYFADGYEGRYDIYINKSEEEGSEIEFEGMQDDLFNI
jgi:hypothetical protein